MILILRLRFFQNLKEHSLAPISIVSLERNKSKKAEKTQLRLEKKIFYEENRSKLQKNQIKTNCLVRDNDSEMEDECFNDLFE